MDSLGLECLPWTLFRAMTTLLEALTLTHFTFFLLGFSKAHSLHSQATHHAGAQEKDHPGGGQPGQVNDQKGLC